MQRLGFDWADFMNYTGSMIKANSLRNIKKHGDSAQEVQDDIFRRMSADRKVELGAELWKLAKDLVGDKIHYGKDRPSNSFGSHHRNSR